jgi:hypothetical protein
LSPFSNITRCSAEQPSLDPNQNEIEQLRQIEDSRKPSQSNPNVK